MVETFPPCRQYKMTKEELITYIHVLYHNWQATDESYNNVMEAAKKLSDNLIWDGALRFLEKTASISGRRRNKKMKNKNNKSLVKLSKKNGFLKLHKQGIVIVLIILGLFALLISCILVYERWNKYFTLYCSCILLGSESISVTIFIYRYFIFLIHEMYLPLTKEELEINNIHNEDEFYSYIYKFLNGFTIKNRSLIKICNFVNYLYFELPSQYEDMKPFKVPTYQELINRIGDIPTKIEDFENKLKEEKQKNSLFYSLYKASQTYDSFSQRNAIYKTIDNKSKILLKIIIYSLYLWICMLLLSINVYSIFAILFSLIVVLWAFGHLLELQECL